MAGGSSYCGSFFVGLYEVYHIGHSEKVLAKRAGPIQLSEQQCY